MKEKLIKALDVLISESTEIMSNRICNDIGEDVLNIFTKEELKTLAKEYHDWNGDPEEWDNDYDVMTYDWIAFGWFWKVLKKVLEDK